MERIKTKQNIKKAINHLPKKVNKIDKSLATVTKIKQETHMSSIRSNKEDTTLNLAEIRIISSTITQGAI